MGFLKDLQEFQRTHPFQEITIDSHRFRYLLCGNPDCPYTLVYFVGGTGNPLGWHRHVLAMEDKYRILLMDYPLGVDEMEPMIRLISRLTDTLGIEKAVWIGASLGGYIAQRMAYLCPEKTAAMVLYATTALTAKGIEDLKKQYRAVGLLLWLLNHVPYGFFKAVTLKPSLSRLIPKGNPVESAYLQEFAQWIYDDYTRETDLHMTSLMADLVNVPPVTGEGLAYLRGRVLLILPREDRAFTKKMQQDLIALVQDAQVELSSGGHLDTLCQAGRFAAITDIFLQKL